MMTSQQTRGSRAMGMGRTVLILPAVLLVPAFGGCYYFATDHAFASVGMRGLGGWPAADGSEPGIGADVSWTPLFPPTTTLAVVRSGNGGSLVSLEFSVDLTPYFLYLAGDPHLASSFQGDWWIVCEPVGGLWWDGGTGDSGTMCGLRTGLVIALHEDDAHSGGRWVIVEYGWHSYSASSGDEFQSKCLRGSFLWGW